METLRLCAVSLKHIVENDYLWTIKIFLFRRPAVNLITSYETIFFMYKYVHKIYAEFIYLNSKLFILNSSELIFVFTLFCELC